MAKRSLSSFPLGGVDLHLSLADALAQGINPGDPAVIEATIRPLAVADLIAKGRLASAASEPAMIRWPSGIAPSMIRWHTPVHERSGARALAVAVPGAERERIAWRPARVVATSGAGQAAAAAVLTPPDAPPNRISWRAGGAAA